MRHAPLDDPDRFGASRHELLSTSTVATQARYASAPQATHVVTTLDDNLDASDGFLSLREAISLANDAPGGDTITFAADLLGGTIRLDPLLGSLSVTGDLAIDGDAGNGGPGSLRLSGNDDPAIEGLLLARDAALHLEDLTVERAFDAGVRGENADLSLERVAIDDISGGAGIAVWLLDGGSLDMRASSITNLDSSSYAGGVYFPGGADVRISDSRIGDNCADQNFGIVGTGTLLLEDSTIEGLTGLSTAGVAVTGDVTIERSTIADVTGYQAGSGVRVDGSLRLVNSTIADIAAGSDFALPAAAVLIRAGGAAEIVSTTISGTSFSVAPGEPFVPRPGLLVEDGASVIVGNSIVDGIVTGTLVSNGANTFADASVDGAKPTDRLGVTADHLFALTKPIGPDGVLAGVLADNGGPTRTIALLDSPDNPALDAADPADSPAADQRGYQRDATPDIGAFELAGTPPPPAPPLPPLAEDMPLADSEIHGAPLFLVGPADDAGIAFVDEVAAYQSSLGVYLVAPDGTIGATRWAFERIEHSEPDPLASPTARPGGGPLTPGDTVLLSDLFDPAELQPGTGFGLFLVADGAALNPFVVFDGGSLAFRSDGDAASITDRVPELVHIAENGVERVIEGDILHTVDAGDPLANSLNPGGTAQVTSGLRDGAFTVAFEDQPLNGSDRDFNDALFTVEPLITEAEVVAV